MNTLRNLVVVGLTAATLALVGSATAGPGWGAGECPRGGPGAGYGVGPGHRGDVEARLERMTQRLDLSEEQRGQVQAILEGAKPDFDGLKAKAGQNRERLQALRGQAGAAKQAEVQTLAQTQGETVAQMIMLRSKVHDQISAVLTDEQRETFAQMGPRGPRAGKRSM